MSRMWSTIMIYYDLSHVSIFVTFIHVCISILSLSGLNARYMMKTICTWKDIMTWVHIQIGNDFFLVQSATHLARQVQQERTQVVYSNKVGRSRLAQRHSRNGPRTYEHWFDVYIGILYWSRHSHTHTYKQTRNWTNHKCIIID